MNFSAFESRFFSTCCRRLTSVRSISDDSSSPISIVKSSPLPSATWRKVRDAEVSHLGEAHAADLNVHLARFDLRQIENVVDQREQVSAGGVNGFRKLDLLRAQVAFCVVGQHARQNQKVVQRRAQLVATCSPGTRSCIWKLARVVRPFPPERASLARFHGS